MQLFHLANYISQVDVAMSQVTAITRTALALVDRRLIANKRFYVQHQIIPSYLELVRFDAVEDEIVLLLLLAQCGQGILGLQMCIGGWRYRLLCCLSFKSNCLSQVQRKIIVSHAEKIFGSCFINRIVAINMSMSILVIQGPQCLDGVEELLHVLVDGEQLALHQPSHHHPDPHNMMLSTCSDSISASSCFTFSSSMGRMSGCSLSLSATPKLSPPRSMSSSILLNSSV